MMNSDHKAILLKANAAVAKGDNEGFLSFCTEDIKYEFVGDQTLQGKDAVREYMKSAYVEPPQFDVEHLIAEGDFLTAIGKISMKDDVLSVGIYKTPVCIIYFFTLDCRPTFVSPLRKEESKNIFRDD